MLKQRGMSIVELMVAMAIGVIISAALASIFVSTTKMKHEIDRMGEQIENGRIAMETLAKDIGLAGFWGGLEYTGIADPSPPDICATDLPNLTMAVPVYIQGVDGSEATPGCLSDRRTDTDIVMVRRAGTCVIGPTTGCESIPPYFQASNCVPASDLGTVTPGTELGSPTVFIPENDYSLPANGQWYRVDSTLTTLTLHTRACNGTTYTDRRRYIARIYFVANNDRAGDGLPSLKMTELQGASWTTPTTIASGIEQLQIEYGQDTGGDTTAEIYVAAPSTVNALRQIVSVKIHILSRNSSPSPDYKNTKTYVLGGETFGPFRDEIRRHSYSGQVGIRNPVGLRGG